MLMKGIDVSYANGSIDWSKAKNEIDFAIIRSSFGSDLPSQIDSQFYQNVRGCEKHNIPYGIYHFAYFIDEDTAIKEADFALRLAREIKDVKFIALDIEEDSEHYAKRMGHYPNWTACCISFMERVKKAGYTPVLYSNQDWLINKMNYEKIRQYKLWYAAPDASSPRYSPAIWQYSWKGRISGICGEVDMNYCYDNLLFSHPSNTAVSSKDSVVPSGQISQLYSSVKTDKDVKIVSENGVNIRNGAGTSYSVMGAIPRGAVVHIDRTTSDRNYQWGLTEYQGVKGWIALNYTKDMERVSIFPGCAVKVRVDAKVYSSDTPLSNWVYNTVFTVIEVSGDRVVIGLNGQITAAINRKDVIPV